MDSASTAKGGEYRRLGVKTLWLFLIKQCFGAFVLFCLWLFLVIFGKSMLPASMISYVGMADIIVFIFFIIITILSVIVALLNYYSYKFMLGDHAFRITRGILNKEEVNIPYRQIQNININRDIVSRIIGVSRITILTAGFEDKNDTAESEGILPVIDQALAEEIQSELLRRAATERQ